MSSRPILLEVLLMKKPSWILCAALAAGVATPVFAADFTCPAHPQAQWLKPSDFIKKVEDQGYSVREFDTKHDCYKIEGTDKAGQRVKVYFDTVSAKPLMSKPGH
jgi:hypothetical protein